MTVRGKGGRVDVLPLPADVGEAMAAYLLHARPTTASRTLFVTTTAPFTGLAVSSITALVARACARAGVPRFGPHGMRHTAACDLLAAGASMEEIGQLLRHAQQRTTALYAKLDQARLAELARALPAGSRAMSMRERVEEYLAMRRSLGYKLAGEGRMLLEFADRLDATGQTTLTVTAAVAWASEPTRPRRTIGIGGWGWCAASPATWPRSIPPARFPRAVCSSPVRTGRRPTCIHRPRSRRSCTRPARSRRPCTPPPSRP